MDGREAMASFYLQRGMGAGGPPGFRQMPNPTHSQSSPPGLGGGTIMPAFQVEPSASAPHGGHVNVGGRVGGMDSPGPGEPLKRKRGRPRKYAPDGTVPLALSPVSPASIPAPGSAAGASSGSAKRGRGRPPGTGRKQQLASLGEWVYGSAGAGFTPHVITIPIGEDIAAKIMSFSQQGPRAVCILSANGSVSTVTLCQPSSSGGTVTYEGRFEILCLSGSYLLSDDGGSRSRSGGLSISLSSPDGRVIGGGVGGLLIAASPVQVIVGSFVYRRTKSKSKAETGQELVISEPSTAEAEKHSTPGPSQSLGASPVMGWWPVSRQMDIQNTGLGIDLMRG